MERHITLQPEKQAEVAIPSTKHGSLLFVMFNQPMPDYT
jgi:hypothetical protein